MEDRTREAAGDRSVHTSRTRVSAGLQSSERKKTPKPRPGLGNSPPAKRMLAGNAPGGTNTAGKVLRENQGFLSFYPFLLQTPYMREGLLGRKINDRQQATCEQHRRPGLPGLPPAVCPAPGAGRTVSLVTGKDESERNSPHPLPLPPTPTLLGRQAFSDLPAPSRRGCHWRWGSVPSSSLVVCPPGRGQQQKGSLCGNPHARHFPNYKTHF